MNKYDELKQKALDLAQNDGTGSAIVDIEKGENIKLGLVTLESLELDREQGRFIAYVHEVIE